MGFSCPAQEYTSSNYKSQTWRCSRRQDFKDNDRKQTSPKKTAQNQTNLTKNLQNILHNIVASTK